MSPIKIIDHLLGPRFGPMFIRFLPPNQRSDVEKVHKIALIFGTNIVLIFLIIPYAIYEYLNRGFWHPGSIANFICILSLLVMGPLIYFTGSIFFASLLMPLTAIIALPLSVIDKGMIFADELMWNTLLPVVACFFCGTRSGFFITLLGCTSVVGMAFYQNAGGYIPPGLTTLNLVHRTVTALSIMLGSWILAAIYEHFRLRAQNQLIEGQRLTEEASRTRSQFLANMSHEIRTPMNGVLAMTELLLDTDLTPEQKNFAQTIHKCGDDLLVIINDILDFSKIAAGKLTLEIRPTAIREMIDDLTLIFSPRLREKKLNFKCTVDPNLPDKVQTDPTRLRQILVNLIGNAIKFTTSGSIVLQVTYDHLGRQIPELFFSVTDTGIGIPNAAFARIFQPYSQIDASTTRRFGGTGLGLVICKSLVEALGGQIWFESEENKGSTFYFKITASPVTATQQLQGVLPIVPKFNLQVLVAEDNDINLQVILLILSKMGIEADSAHNGKEVLAALEKQRYDVVFMDCQMPEMDGFEATRRIYELYNDDRPRIIAITASAMKEDRAHCLATGMDDFISKPVTREAVFEALSKISE